MTSKAFGTWSRDKTEAGELTQQVRGFMLSLRTYGWLPEPMSGGSELRVTLVPGDLTIAAGLPRSTYSPYTFFKMK